MKKTSQPRPVVICTEYRGVFFGYATNTAGDIIALTKARNCISWTKAVGGVLGLASNGPNGECRIGARADVELRKVTAVMECSPEAVAAWEAASTVK